MNDVEQAGRELAKLIGTSNAGGLALVKQMTDSERRAVRESYAAASKAAKELVDAAAKRRSEASAKQRASESRKPTVGN